MSDTILVVDDEREIADLIALYLRNESYVVYQAATAREAMEHVDKIDCDLAILDIMLPDMDGLSLCQKIREKHSYPIIMLTAKDSETDKITGLTFGADDYVTKPFRPLELVARVKAQLRRYKTYNEASEQQQQHGGGGKGGSGGIIIHNGLVINNDAHECFLDEQPLSLTPTEFSILRILCENKGAVVSSEQLFHELWGDEYYSRNNNTITVHIRHLREKMNDTADNPRYIKTVWGVGYKIES
jgi:two-component system response regulator VanR